MKGFIPCLHLSGPEYFDDTKILKSYIVQLHVLNSWDYV